MYVLYNHPISQHSRRVMALLVEAGLAYENRHVALDQGEHMAPAYLAVNPNHQVPTLIDGDVKIHESNAILRYLCNANGLEDWYPSDPATRAQVDQWLDWTQCRFSPAVVDIVFNTVFAGENGDKEAIKRGHARMMELLPILDAGLSGRKFLTGDKPTIADLALGTNVTHLALANAAPGGPNIVAWVERLATLKGFAATMPQLKAA
ncbi:MAG: glutathione S-transferase family protein [Proteobacteria bacterium]|nr:glutathione S-transferase family protein [Pseudomonadota bacterium]